MSFLHLTGGEKQMWGRYSEDFEVEREFP